MVNLPVGAYSKKKHDTHAFTINIIFHRDELGFIAFVFVVEKHRKKGLGSALIRHLSQKVIERGCCPFANVVVGNDPSCKMFEGVGFHRLKDRYTYIGYSF